MIEYVSIRKPHFNIKVNIKAKQKVRAISIESIQHRLKKISQNAAKENQQVQKVEKGQKGDKIV